MAHKRSTGLSTLIRALQNAVIKAQELIRHQHLNTVQQYIDADGNVETLKMRVPVPPDSNSGAGGYREIEVPKLALMPPSSIKLEKLKMAFDVELSGLEHDECDDHCNHEMNITMSRGLFSRSTKAKCEITFKGDEAPEGILKINDELMKFL